MTEEKKVYVPKHKLNIDKTLEKREKVHDDRKNGFDRAYNKLIENAKKKAAVISDTDGSVVAVEKVDGDDDIETVDIETEARAPSIDKELEEAKAIFNKAMEEVVEEVKETSEAIESVVKAVEEAKAEEVPAIEDKTAPAAPEVKSSLIPEPQQIVNSAKGLKEVAVNTGCRFKVKTPYNERQTICGILDQIFASAPDFSYTIEECMTAPIYKMTVSKGGVMIGSFQIDPRYRFGLGIPAIQLQMALLAGGVSFEWVPLGFTQLIKPAIFLPSPITEFGPVLPIQYCVPEAAYMRAMRTMWPDMEIYDSLDMTGTQIVNGKKYQDFGYYVWQTLNTLLTKRGIHGRFRAAKIVRPDEFTLMSDRNIQPTIGQLLGYDYDSAKNSIIPLDVVVKLKGDKIYIKSILNSEKEVIDLDIAQYPPMDRIRPLPGETSIVQYSDIIECPLPISEAWKQMAKVKFEQQKQEEQAVTPEQTTPSLDEAIIPLETVFNDIVSNLSFNVDEDKIKAQWNMANAS